MKKIHLTEIVCVVLVMSILLYFSIPIFMDGQVTAKVKQLKMEAKAVVESVQSLASSKDSGLIDLADIRTHLDQYNIQGSSGSDGGTISLETYMLHVNESLPSHIMEELIVLQVKTTMQPMDHDEFVTAVMTTTPNQESVMRMDTQLMDRNMRRFVNEYITKQNRYGIQPVVDYLESISYDVTNGINSSGYIISYATNSVLK